MAWILQSHPSFARELQLWYVFYFSHNCFYAQLATIQRYVYTRKPAGDFWDAVDNKLKSIRVAAEKDPEKLVKYEFFQTSPIHL
jgi:hypothetical protein